MSEDWTEGLDSGSLCSFCSYDPTQMISRALHDKYTYVKNAQYLKSTEQIVEGERITLATVEFLQWQFLEDNDETLKRYYYDFQYPKRSHRFGEYYEHHRQFPRFSDVEIYKIKRKHCQKMREYEYKLVKRLLNDDRQSVSENTKTENDDENSKQTEISNVLRQIRQEQEQKQEQEESRIFGVMVNQLEELTRGKEESFSFDCDFYGKKRIFGTGLDVYLQKIVQKKKKYQNSIISTQRRHPTTSKKRLNNDSQKDTLKVQPRPHIIRNFSGNNLLFKFQRPDAKQSIATSLSRTKSTFNIATKIPVWLNRDARQKSIEKIYGKQSRYASIDSKYSDNQVNPEAESKSKKRISFRVNQIVRKGSQKRETDAGKSTVDKFADRKDVKRENRVMEMEQQTIESGIRGIKLEGGMKMSMKKLTSSGLDGEQKKQSKPVKKLDVVKVYKKIKGLI